MDGNRSASLRTRVIIWWGAWSLVFGILSALRSDVDSILGFVVLAVVVGSLWGVPTAILIIVFATRADRRTRQREGLPAKGRWDPVGVRQTLVVEAPPGVAFARAVDAMRGMRKASLKHVDDVAGVIEGRVGLTWRSWGERLTVRVKRHAANQSEIEVVSEPLLSITIADYGKNQRNVDDFLAAMQ